MYLVLIGIDRSEYRRASTASDACVQIQAHKTDKIRSRNIEHIIISSLLATVEVGKRSCERDLNALLIKCQQGSVSLPALSKTFSGSLRGVSEIVGRMIERLGIVGRVNENFWKEVTLRTCYLLGWGVLVNLSHSSPHFNYAEPRQEEIWNRWLCFASFVVSDQIWLVLWIVIES